MVFVRRRWSRLKIIEENRLCFICLVRLICACVCYRARDCVMALSRVPAISPPPRVAETPPCSLLSPFPWIQQRVETASSREKTSRSRLHPLLNPRERGKQRARRCLSHARGWGDSGDAGKAPNASRRWWEISAGMRLLISYA